jgi:hypothetical protein
MQGLGGIDDLIMGGKGTNLGFDHKFNNLQLKTWNTKSFKLQPKALFMLQSLSIPKCQHFKLLAKCKLSFVFTHLCSFFSFFCSFCIV